MEENKTLFRRIAEEQGMKFTELFERFMQLRFPKEKSKSYITEWANRFLSGNPTAYMDRVSLKCYIDAIKLIN